jgi:hypothetical protein
MNYSKILISSLIIALFYIALITLLMNTDLVRSTFLGSYRFLYKIKIVTGLIKGMWTSMSGVGFFLLVTTAVLTGLNLSLLTQKVKNLKSQGNLRLIVGGSSIIGVISSGCAACGLPILAILGLGGSLAFLPLRGMELSYLSVIMLSYSLYLLVKPIPVNNCNINK